MMRRASVPSTLMTRIGPRQAARNYSWATPHWAWGHRGAAQADIINFQRAAHAAVLSRMDPRTTANLLRRAGAARWHQVDLYGVDADDGHRHAANEMMRLADKIEGGETLTDEEMNFLGEKSGGGGPTYPPDTADNGEAGSHPP